MNTLFSRISARIISPFICYYQKPKKISAMVRVRNEEEYLFTSVASIAELVDEVVIIDN